MAKKFRDLVAQMPEERQARLAAETRRLIDEMPLQELRRALDLTQQQVAAALGINQVAVSKMEGQTDMYVSTLRRFVEAMGGERLTLLGRQGEGLGFFHRRPRGVAVVVIAGNVATPQPRRRAERPEGRALPRRRFGRFRFPLELADFDGALREVGHDAQLAAHRFDEAAQGTHVPIGLTLHLGDSHLIDAERSRDRWLDQVEGLARRLQRHFGQQLPVERVGTRPRLRRHPGDPLRKFLSHRGGAGRVSAAGWPSPSASPPAPPRPESRSGFRRERGRARRSWPAAGGAG